MKNTPFSTIVILNIHILKHIIKVQNAKIEELEREKCLSAWAMLDERHKRSEAFSRGFNTGLVYNRPDSSDDEGPDVYDRCDEDEGPDVYGVFDVVFDDY